MSNVINTLNALTFIILLSIGMVASILIVGITGEFGVNVNVFHTIAITVTTVIIAGFLLIKRNPVAA